MTDRNDRPERSGDRRPAEGVRIIGAEEAQKALDAGQVAGRRSEDELRFGDVPPAPSGPRPPHRFPLPDSVDPAVAVPRPPVAPIRTEHPPARPGRHAEAAGAAPVEAPAGPDGAADAPVAEVPVADPPVAGPGGPADPVTAEVAEVPGPAVGAPDDPTGPIVMPSFDTRRGVVADQPRPAPAPLQWAPEEGPDGAPVGTEPEFRVAEPPPAEPRPATSLDVAVLGDPVAYPETGAVPILPADPTVAVDVPPTAHAWNLGERDDLAAPGAGPASSLEDRITVTGSHVLPDWTAPAAGALPTGLERDDDDVWSAAGAGGVRWHSEHDDWDDDDAVDYLADGGDDLRVGALEAERDDPSGLYSFDEDFERLEEERAEAAPALSIDGLAEDLPAEEPPPLRPARAGTRLRPPPAAAPPRPARAPADTLSSRLAVGVGLVVVLVICYAIGADGLLALFAVGVLACAVEAYGVLQRSGFRPATMLGLVASAGVMVAAYWRGPVALPVVVGLTFAATMVWYLIGITDARPLANVAVTTMMVIWIGMFGSYAALMLRADKGRGLLLGAVVVTVVSDIASYFVGRQFGRRALAPGISPGKTVEGFVAGAVAAVVLGAVVGREIAPWGGLRHGLALGVVVAVVAPIGDLFESSVKRDLHMKDSGTALAGHGGLLDRFDSLLLVLPAAYYLADALHLVRVV